MKTALNDCTVRHYYYGEAVLCPQHLSEQWVDIDGKDLADYLPYVQDEENAVSVQARFYMAKDSGSRIICTLCNSPAVEDDELSPAWDACYTCGKVAPLDIHGECISCELKAGK